MSSEFELRGHARRAGHVPALRDLPYLRRPRRVAILCIASMHALAGAAGATLSDLYSETGKIFFSIDGTGTNSSLGATVEVEKPAGATTRRATFACASTGFSGHVIADGEITIDGAGVTWDAQISNSIGSSNHVADVTALVGPTIDAAPPGRVPFLIVEASPSEVDGCLLAVVLDDPSQTSDSTVIVQFGAQATMGDDFAITLAEPLDLGDPSSRADMGLAISYSFQGGGPPSHLCGTGSSQFSEVDVNGTRITSCAGDFDDAAESGSNGNLFTVGGLDDLNDNPADPNQIPADGALPRVLDDELYGLKPFVMSGDTQIAVHTLNPSNDDNIFLAYFVTSVPAVVGEGILLSPVEATNVIGSQHTVTARIVNTLGDPVVGRLVTFNVISGPNAGVNGSQATDANGEATFAYTGNVVGDDQIQASFVDSNDETQTSNVAVKHWVQPAAECGNGTVEAGEECDDGNTVSGDGCSATCQLEEASCGDGTVNPASEECDDGNTEPGDGCSATCEIEENCSNLVDDDANGLVDCADTTDCDCLGLVRARPHLRGAELRFRPALDVLQLHLQVSPATPISPTAEVNGVVLSNLNGVVVNASLPPGSLTSPNGKRFRYRNPAARKLGGIGRFHVILRPNGSYRVDVDLYGDFSAATLPDMTLQLTLGDDSFSNFSTWVQVGNGWNMVTP